MQITFLGTGAADWNWSIPLDDTRRGSCCTLLDGKVLIDAGATVLQSLDRCAVAWNTVEAVVLTHSHSDHFNVQAVNAIAEAPGRTQKLHFFGAPEAAALLNSSVEKHPLQWGDRFEFNRLAFTVLPANHLINGATREESFNYLITTPEGKRLFYALDSAWITTRARHLLGGELLDMIIWDATSGTTFCDWRFAEHNDLKMIAYMRESMLKAKLISGSTGHVFNHIARTLWPADDAARSAAAAEYDGILAFDGMQMTL